MVIKNCAAIDEHWDVFLIENLNPQSVGRVVDHQTVLHVVQLGGLLQRLSNFRIDLGEALEFRLNAFRLCLS